MSRFNEGTVIVGCAGTVLTPGTLTGTGISWTPTYDRVGIAAFNVGVSDGSLVCHVQQSASLATGYTTIGSAVANGAAAGTQCYQVRFDPTALTAQYLRTLVTCVGGTAVVSASIVGKARTVTDL